MSADSLELERQRRQQRHIAARHSRRSADFGEHSRETATAFLGESDGSRDAVAPPVVRRLSVSADS